MNQVRRVVACENQLGEGSVWDVAEQALYWVDIVGRKLQRFHEPSGEIRVWVLPERLASFALRGDGGLVCAFASGFAFFDLDTGRIDWIARPEAHMASNRSNDGKCDAHGRFWMGSMNEADGGPTGALYRLDPDRSVHRMDTGIAISNAICWSPDGRRLYFADTPDREIRVYDCDPASGAISNKRRFVKAPGPGYPDGATVDAEGYIWNAEWDGWRVVRYAPDGRVDRVLDVPVQRPTCCAFGGKELRTLYITSAAMELDRAALERQPWAGSLLAIDLDVAGLPSTRFAG